MEPREKELFSVFHQYKDVYCTSTSRKVCQAYVMHALNHVTKTDKMTRNNSQKLLTMTEMEKNDSDIRDKQLMKPKVLIIVPFKSVAKKVMDEIERQMTPPSGKFEIGYKKRFEKEFGSDPKLEKIKREKNRPDDYKRTFAGNNEEAFRVGLSFSPKGGFAPENFKVLTMYQIMIIMKTELGTSPRK
jgi:U3 small nucleolar RNA-associated protein 25